MLSPCIICPDLANLNLKIKRYHDSILLQLSWYLFIAIHIKADPLNRF